MIVSLLGLVISLFAYLLAFPKPEQRRFDIYAALLALHIGGSVAFWLMSFESGMDAFMYYRDPFGFVDKDPFEAGTYFIVHLVQLIRRTLGGSFLDHFLFFQCFGMIGMALLIRMLNEVADALETSVPLVVYFSLFLPGIHFWTAGIGKDGIMVMAVCLAGWSTLRLEKRLVWMGLALAIMICVRPHIATFTAAGVVAALLLSARIPARLRLMLAPVAAAGVLLVAVRAMSHFQVSMDLASVSDFIENQQQLGERFGKGADLGSLPLPLKIFSFLYRPLFIDAVGMVQYIASVENAILLFLTIYVAYHWKLLLGLVRRVFFITYFIVFDLLMVLSFSMVSYNIGMGQRMKMMAVPGLLLLFGTIYIYKRSPVLRRQAQVVQAQPPRTATAAAAQS